MRHDITDREDIEHLVREFYSSAINDEEIGYIFTEVAKIDLEHHLPIIADFWETALFHTGSYRNDTLAKHLALNQKEKLSTLHFQRWLKIFLETVDQLFIGTTAEMAKNRARSIATVIQIKIQQDNEMMC